LDITGVLLELIGSLLLQTANKIRPQRTRTALMTVFVFLTFFVAELVLRILDLFVVLVLGHGRFMFLGDWFARHAILTLNPTAKIDKLAPLRTEGTERIIFPLDWLTARWTLHES
jgi:hypothetical protein